MSLSLNQKPTSLVNGAKQSFKVTSKDNKRTSKKKKPIFKIILIVISILFGTSYAVGAIERSNLERGGVPIIISDVDDEISIDYYTDSREISVKISGISMLAQVEVAGKNVNVSDRRDSAGIIKYEIKNIAEGETKVTISAVDGKRHAEKAITLKRQTKADYDKQELEKALKRAEESTKKAESDPSDENIASAKSDIEKLPKDKRQPFDGRVAALEKTKQEEKDKREREEKAKKEAEEQKHKAEEAAATREYQRQMQQQSQSMPQQTRPSSVQPRQATPAPSGPYFGSCKQARAAGYSHMRRGEPGYSSQLDGDNDGIACDKHR